VPSYRVPLSHGMERVSAYVNARDILKLSEDELRALRDLKFSSAISAWRAAAAGPTTNQERRDAGPHGEMAAKPARPTIALSVIVLLGAGGTGVVGGHARRHH